MQAFPKDHWDGSETSETSEIASEVTNKTSESTIKTSKTLESTYKNSGIFVDDLTKEPKRRDFRDSISYRIQNNRSCENNKF